MRMNSTLTEMTLKIQYILIELSKSIEGDSALFGKIDADEEKSYELIPNIAFASKQEKDLKINEKGEEEGVRNTGYFLHLWGKDKLTKNDKWLAVTYSILPFEYNPNGLIKTVFEIDEEGGGIVQELETSFGFNSQYFTAEEIAEDMLSIFTATRDAMKSQGFLKDVSVVGAINV